MNRGPPYRILEARSNERDVWCQKEEEANEKRCFCDNSSFYNTSCHPGGAFFFFLMKEFAVTEMVEAKAGQKIIRKVYSDRTSQNHGYNMRA